MNSQRIDFTMARRLLVAIFALVYGIYTMNLELIIIFSVFFIGLIYIYASDAPLLKSYRNELLYKYDHYIVCKEIHHRLFKGIINNKLTEWILFDFQKKRYLQVFLNGYGMGVYEFEIEEIDGNNAIDISREISSFGFGGYEGIYKNRGINSDVIWTKMDFEIVATRIFSIINSSVNSETKNGLENSMTIKLLEDDIKTRLSQLPTIKSILIDNISSDIVNHYGNTISLNIATDIVKKAIETEFFKLVKVAEPLALLEYNIQILNFKRYIITISEIMNNLTNMLKSFLKIDASSIYFIDEDFKSYKEFVLFWTNYKDSIPLSDDRKKKIDDKINDISNRYKVYEEQKAILENELRLKYPRSRLYKQK